MDEVMKALDDLEEFCIKTLAEIGVLRIQVTLIKQTLDKIGDQFYVRKSARYADTAGGSQRELSPAFFYTSKKGKQCKPYQSKQR